MIVQVISPVGWPKLTKFFLCFSSATQGQQRTCCIQPCDEELDGATFTEFADYIELLWSVVFTLLDISI